METFHDEYSAEYQAQHKTAWENLDKKDVLKKELSQSELACTKNPTEYLLRKIESLRTEIKLLNDSIFPPDLPIFIIPLRPDCVPVELKTLPKETWVRWKSPNATETEFSQVPAGDLVDEIAQTIEQQGKGFFKVEKAAQILADSLKDVPAKEMLEQMLAAHTTGKLVIRDWGHYMPTSSNHEVRGYLNLVKATDIDAWLETQGVDYRFPSAQTAQMDSRVTIDKNDIQFVHEIEFVAFGYLAGLLARAQCFGEVDNTDLNEYLSRIKHGEALLSAAQNGDLPIKDKSTKTKVNLGSVQLNKNRIDKSTCVAVADFQTYAKTLGVNVSVAELNDVLQKIEIETGIEPTQSSVAKSVKRTKATTWRDIAWSYVITTYQAGQYKTAKELFKKLENTAGQGNSPFKKGEGDLRGSLFIEQTNSSLAPKTLANAWKEIRESPRP